MSRLFIQLYLDEDVSAVIAKIIRARAFSVTTTAEEAQLGQTDASQLAYAAEHGMAIVTHNSGDFVRLFNESLSTGKSHCGIIIAVRRLPNEVAGRLLKILNSMTADEMDNQLLYV